MDCGGCGFMNRGSCCLVYCGLFQMLRSRAVHWSRFWLGIWRRFLRSETRDSRKQRLHRGLHRGLAVPLAVEELLQRINCVKTDVNDLRAGLEFAIAQASDQIFRAVSHVSKAMAANLLSLDLYCVH